LVGSDFEWVVVDGSRTPGAINANQVFGAPLPAVDPFINEFHYDNSGTDVGEFIEVAVPQGTDLSDYSIVLYNGSGGAPYGASPISLAGLTIQNTVDGYGFVVLDFPSNGIQNGAPDGICLTGPSGSVIEFLSYEASPFAAVGGPCDGVVSTDIGVSQTSGTAEGSSLQRQGTGLVGSDFEWVVVDGSRTPGAINTNQVFAEPSVSTTAVPPTTSSPPTEPTLTLISTIQGSSSSSPLVGTTVKIQGIVTGDFQSNDSDAGRDLRGFFVQEEDVDADGDMLTSEGIFVFDGSTPAVDVNVGDLVEVIGVVDENFGTFYRYLCLVLVPHAFLQRSLVRRLSHSLTYMLSRHS
jgi:hypothetical protein